jgi:hypothetical protein
MKVSDPREIASPKPKGHIGWVGSWLCSVLLTAGMYVDMRILKPTYVDLFRHMMLLGGFLIACHLAWCGIRTLVGEWRYRSYSRRNAGAFDTTKEISEIDNVTETGTGPHAGDKPAHDAGA